MCEPHQSITQFPSLDDGGNPTESRIDALPKGESWVSWMKKKIGSWIHFSKMGFGHSESLGQIMNPVVRNMLPRDTKYETQWWIRNVKRDGMFYGNNHDMQEALDCAKEYAMRTSIGNLHLLRQFLTVSIRKSMRPFSYVDSFMKMLTKEGKDALNKRMKFLSKEDRNGMIAVLMGFTRKRDLLVPEWSDTWNVIPARF